MGVRCKFRVMRNSENPFGTEGRDITMEVVHGGSPENEKYWKYTPAGTLVFSCLNEAASSQLEVGKEYFLDITPAE